MHEFQNIEAEKAIIHILFRHPHKIAEIDGAYLKSSDFTKHVFAEIYQVIYQLYVDNAKVEPASVIAQGRAMGFRFVDSPKNIKSIEALCQAPADHKNLMMYCKIVKNLSLRALLYYHLEQARAQVVESETAQEAIDKTWNIIEDFTMSNDSDDEIVEIGKELDGILKELAKEPEVGLSTGFPTYDKLIGGGLRGGSINVIGARLKVGKTQIAMNIALHNAMRGVPVLYLDTELEKRDEGARIAGMLGQIPFDLVETGEWLKIQEHVNSYKAVRDQIKSMPFNWVKIAGKSIEEVIGIIRRFITKKVRISNSGRYNRCLIVYDYLKIMSEKDLSRSAQEYQVLGYRVSQLHDLMGQYNAAMLMTLQLNRDGIEKENSSAASQSDRIMWLCDNFTIFKPLSAEELSLTRNTSNHKLFVSDTRYGPGNRLGQFIGLYADKSRGFFKDMGLIKVVQDVA